MNINQLLLTEVLQARRAAYVAAPTKESKNLARSDILCGIEIELEDFRDRNAALDRLRNWWDEHQEGSLLNGREFVLHPPRNGEELDQGIDKFFDAGFKYTGGERTSVHVHTNMLDGTTVGQFRSMFVLTYLLEGAIYRIADENRKWAGYSCPLIDMGPSRLNKILNGQTAGVFHSGLVGKAHEEKYYGFNCVSLNKHGTMEFRYFPCTDDKKVMYQWLNLCLELKAASQLFNEPQALLALLGTQDDLIRYIRGAFPRSAEDILGYLDRPDTMERVKVLTAVLNDDDAAYGASKIPRGWGESKSLKKAVERLGWAQPQQVPAVAKQQKVKRVDDYILPDGQIDEQAWNALMHNIRARANRLDNI